MKRLGLFSCMFILQFQPVMAAELLKGNVEEARIPLAEKAISESIKQTDNISLYFSRLWPKVENYQDAVTLINFYGLSLWQQAKQNLKDTQSYDDRGLYWQRLKLSKILRTINPEFLITDKERLALLKRLEKVTRGISDLEYRHETNKRILLTGFDPFFLDKHINQSNPSGVVAMLLDGKVINHNGVSAEINTFVVPVRYDDFDQGLIEETMAPYFALDSVDMVITVSMGRKDFDLERFPGKRRSAEAMGNLNTYSGGSKQRPIVAKLYNRPLPGPEFVEFSLPVKSMQQAKGPFKIIDNHQVTTLEKTFKPESLEELNGAIAVAGSGGGYLSNEISYRSIRLRDQLDSKIPTGHIHTPRVQQFESDTNKVIVEEIINMLELSLSEL